MHRDTEAVCLVWVVAKANNTILTHTVSIKIVMSNTLQNLTERLISAINHPEVNYFHLT